MMIQLARLSALGCLLSLAQAAQAQAPAPFQPPVRPPAPPLAKPKPPVSPRPAADPAYAASQAAFEALPEALRKAIQDSLVWTGDYNAVTAGTYGRRTYEGIVAWQKRQGLEPTGILGARDRTALDAAGEAARKALRFTVQADPASGAVIGVPEKLLAKKSPLPRGTRWQSADARVTLDTTSYPAGSADLDGLFERATAVTPERKITYKVKKPDFLVVTGETPTGRFYIRHAAGAEGIRGFTMAYDKALTAEVDRLVIAVANSYLPFPEATPAPEAKPVAAAPNPYAGSGKPAGNTASPLAPPPLPGLTAPPAATGFAIGNGRILTSAAALEHCTVPRVGGAAARAAGRDATGNLALLETDARNPAAALPAIRSEPVTSGEALVVVGAEAKGAAVAPGSAGSGSVVAPLQPGAGGAPVLDRSGRLVGLVARFATAPRLIAGVMPPTSYAVVPGNVIAAFLAQAGVNTAKAAPNAAPAPASLGAAAAPVLGSIVAITCAR
nr:peptidoglycan-binding protein [Methylobacterium brachythecii]